MLHFVAIDFETANEKRSSPCAVGVVVVEDGKLVDSFYTLIKPRECRFSDYNTYIHGITAEDVRDKPEFPEVWGRLKKLVEPQIVLAHNASFDMSVLRNTLAEYQLRFPEITYSCTRMIAKVTWPGLISYKLAMLAKLLEIEFNHHHALDDARACAEIAGYACQKTDSRTLDDLAECLGLRHGRILMTGDYYPPGKLRRGTSSRIDIEAFRRSSQHLDPNHPFFERIFVFTGALESMTRRQAMQVVVDLGGALGKGVTKQTNFLIVGDQDYRNFADGQTKSSKMRKAEALLAKGQDIEVLTEEDFLQMLGI